MTHLMFQIQYHVYIQGTAAHYLNPDRLLISEFKIHNSNIDMNSDLN